MHTNGNRSHWLLFWTEALRNENVNCCKIIIPTKVVPFGAAKFSNLSKLKSSWTTKSLVVLKCKLSFISYPKNSLHWTEILVTLSSLKKRKLLPFCLLLIFVVIWSFLSWFQKGIFESWHCVLLSLHFLKSNNLEKETLSRT